MTKGERARGSKTDLGDGRWRLTYDVPPEPGKTRAQRRVTFRGTERQADLRLAKLLEDAWSRGVVLDARTTLGDYLTREWLPHYQRRRRPKSYETRETAVRLHIIPYLGQHKLAELRPRTIQTWVDGREDAGFAANTIRAMVDTLRLALNQAVAWELIDRNPAAALALPEPGAPIAQAWTAEETRAFLAHPAARADLCLWVVIANAQLRRGEAAGLQWGDVDFDRGLIVVRRQAQQQRGGGFALAEPKTAKSTRVLPMAAAVMTMLEAHKRDQALRRAELTALGVWAEGPWLFDRGDGKPLTPWTIWTRFRRACELAGVTPIRLHDLRGTGLTLMGVGGVPDLVLRDRAAHTSFKTTQGYLNPAAEVQRVGAEVLAEMLGLGAEDRVLDERPAD